MKKFPWWKFVPRTVRHGNLTQQWLTQSQILPHNANAAPDCFECISTVYWRGKLQCTRTLIAKRILNNNCLSCSCFNIITICHSPHSSAIKKNDTHKNKQKKFCFFFFLTTASNACWKLIFRQFTCRVTYSNLLAEKYCKIIKRHDWEPILSQVSLKRFLCKCYSIINTNLRYVGAWIGSYFLKNKKHIQTESI